MFKNLLTFKYPQSIWSHTIYNMLLDNDILSNINYIYDAPCGYGWVSHNMMKKISNPFILVDNDFSKIHFVKKYIVSKRALCRKFNLYDLEFKEKSLWLLINSLYLLSDIDGLIEREKGNIDYIVGVFPYTNSVNYNYFVNKVNSELNTNAKNMEETVNYFESHGYELIDFQNTTYFNYLCYNGNLVVRYLSSIIFSLLEMLFNFGGKNYWIGIFRKENKKCPDIS